MLLLPFVRKLFCSDRDLAPNCSRVFCQVKSISTCTRCGSRRRPLDFLQKVLSNPAYQRILLRTDTDTLLLYPARTPCSTSLLSNSLVVHRASSCRAQNSRHTCRFATNFHKPACSCCNARHPCFFLVLTHSELAFHGTKQCLAMSRKAPSSRTTDTSLPSARMVGGSIDTLDPRANTWTLLLFPEGMGSSSPSVVVLIILLPSVHAMLLSVK